jgi:hypothetical protein
MEMVEGLLLDGIDVERGYSPIGERYETSLPVLTSAAPASSPRHEQATSLTDVAAHFAAHGLLQQ